MRILLTNDDGIFAPGLLAMYRELTRMGEVTIVAPATPQSGVGHAISVSQPLFCQEIDVGDGIRGFRVEGRPADCVKLAVLELLKDRPPEMVVSGVNHGENVGINVLYSGTVAAAIEGAFFGLPSLAVSLAFGDRMEFHAAAWLARRLIRQVFDLGRARGMLFNVNIPDLTAGPPKGVRVCRMTVRPTQEGMIRRKDPRGRPYFWMTGGFVPAGEPDPDSDLVALAQGFVTVTPLKFDLTDAEALADVGGWSLRLTDFA